MLNNTDHLNILVKTLPGLETVLAREIKALGGRQVRERKRAVSCMGDLGFVYKANLWLRTALRVLVTLEETKIRNEKELYKKVLALPWEDLFEVHKSIAIDATVFSRQFKNSLFVAQRTKDAIADRFREKTNGQRPNVNTTQPDIRINIHLNQERLTISLDSSGESLHKRNYRQRVDRAPINEVLAAGLIALSGWDKKSDFVDPMCGSGTLLIEAAFMAYNLPPNVFRKSFCFRNWRNFDDELFNLIFEKSLEKETTFNGKIIGFDSDRRVLSKARQNIRRALMQDQIEVYEADLTQFDQQEVLPPQGTAIFNPPYDVKLSANVEELYYQISNSLKDNFKGYNVWVFSASAEGLKKIHLKADTKIPLMNAKLESWLVGYTIFK